MLYFVHGAFTVGRNMDLLTAALQARGHRTADVDYGWTHLLNVRGITKAAAKVFASLAKPGSVAIGHSNGCNVIHKAAQQGARFSRVIYISPALDRDLLTSGQHVQRMDVLHTRHDGWVKLARFIPWSIWGDMGAYGSSHPPAVIANKRYSPRKLVVKNYDCSDLIDGHSAWFGKINWLAGLIDRILKT